MVVSLEIGRISPKGTMNPNWVMQKRSPKHRLIYLIINDDVLKALLGRKAVKTSPDGWVSLLNALPWN
ncbi:TPA: hypothetical protein I8Z91_002085 [Legionella pneumophila]|uniref:hypothetical protein n=1 Tax=Legionella pneumophila TaxID=446 RepID=UPI00048D4DF5|nr:hypothetical protein [Legionella pneumophila]HAT1868116.1 hypothetical protein [Legionella pneumophila]HAT1908245.1 hypothetical protein [Legionella pneumophila]HAT1985046.1 hypothetical protein [Legionella pneumophila]HAT4008250.1 hypothetical protein [Legionella pneumophila]HCR5301631.1 hypothetical protein [Legionella pneumophila]